MVKLMTKCLEMNGGSCGTICLKAIAMRERLSAVDTVGRTTLNQATPIITCKSNKPMERTKNGARYFRNPPQPHMCIQDFILGSKEPCYINVLSWIKISTPRRPEDPIPLYGGMRIPYNSITALSNDKKKHPIIFAVMANPEILRLSGKTAKDPMDQEALVDLMIDFVEAMNPEVKFKRQFLVLKDRDLTGELKDIWLAIQVKREKEKEKAQNGKKSEIAEKNREETKVGEHSRDSVSYWLEMDRGKNIGPEIKAEELDSKNQLLPHNGAKPQINSVIEGPVTPSPKSSPTHQRKSKIRSSKGELFIQTVHHVDRKSGGDSNLDVHVSEICTVTKHTMFKEIFPSSSDSSEDEERGDLRLNNTPASLSKLNVDDIGMDSVGSDSTNKAASLEEATNSENSGFESHNVKPCKFLRIKSSSVKKSIEKQGKQNVHVANKFKNHDKGDCESVARFRDYDC